MSLKGKTVRVVKGKANGAEGVVFWEGMTKWGSPRVGLKTASGESVWAALTELALADPVGEVEASTGGGAAVDADVLARLTAIEGTLQTLAQAVAGLAQAVAAMQGPAPVAEEVPAPANVRPMRRRTS